MVSSNDEAPAGANMSENADCRLPHKQADLCEIAERASRGGGEFSTVAIYGCYRCGNPEHEVHVAHATGTTVSNVDDLVSLIKALRQTAHSLEKLLGRPA